MVVRGPMAARGFTLIELLVVIGVIAVLVAILLPAVQKVREAANRTHCQNNLKQLGLALHSYHNVQGSFPGAAAWDNPGGKSDASDYAGRRPWCVRILPYIEQDNVYNVLATADST